MVFHESESQGWCTECAYFLANSEPRGAYSAGAYKKKRVVEEIFEIQPFQVLKSDTK